MLMLLLLALLCGMVFLAGACAFAYLQFQKDGKPRAKEPERKQGAEAEHARAEE